MASVSPLLDPPSKSLPRSTPITVFFHRQISCLISSHPVLVSRISSFCCLLNSRRSRLTVASVTTLMSNSVQNVQMIGSNENFPDVIRSTRTQVNVDKVPSNKEVFQNGRTYSCYVNASDDDPWSYENPLALNLHQH